MAEERDFEATHARGEREAEDMERRSEQLEEQIERTRDEWDAKKSDESVPGAPPDPDEGERGEEDGPPREATPSD
jgi:hypothetical protein